VFASRETAARAAAVDALPAGASWKVCQVLPWYQ
jgi:hypothetical protein